ncbi:alpha-ribazole phosphatase [Flavihumibacter profundi]|uniref:alpha-ribazole phosphatase n=1 Tax=Flavihumibacter profundi TaxID=2716883 RepID=UPI001CC6DD18|nr:alpha-ribazole phosphatase [Flavihumibacter profundi]MBZ5858022.1 alpha-ribazole phosphatase [Flavihumibacter profundi]
MNIYLIRHTRPAVGKGICYGQTDLDVVETFHEEAAVIKNHLPGDISKVYSSPLRRCRLLAEHLFPNPIDFHDDLKELHCGSWEMQHWDEIPREELKPWMEDFVQVRVPGGESYMDLFTRVVLRYEAIASRELPAAIVAHGGVIRSILSHVKGVPLKDAFNHFPLYYGAVAKINTVSGEIEMLSNIEIKGEQHRPSDWVK